MTGSEDRSHFSSNPRHIAVVLGTNEIASAIAVFLHRAQCGVVLSHDPLPPVIRRRMAFHDALFDEPVEVDGIEAVRVDGTLDALTEAMRHERVVVTRLGLSDLLPMAPIDVLVDARMHKRMIMPHLRHLARVAVGVGPGFTAGRSCDLAIETHPDRTGMILRSGPTEAATGISRSLGRAGRERFVYSEAPGTWHTPLEIGRRVYKGVLLGRLDGQEVLAPMDGVLRGLARDGTEVPARVKLIEIDPRGRAADWVCMDERSCKIAEATLLAVRSAIAHPAGDWTPTIIPSR